MLFCLHAQRRFSFRSLSSLSRRLIHRALNFSGWEGCSEGNEQSIE
ncbi:hypothetical protein E1171_11075 [Cytophagales bacterium RKSG123]|nr:hypothetical protein [Xanthovirga aplysinae]